MSARCAQISTSTDNYTYNGTYYAVFVLPQAVQVYTENASFGTASIDKTVNNVGDVVSLTANEALFNHGFVGWRKESEGEIVSSENPYTFTITEQNKGKYYAVFRDDYEFYRIKNYATKRYLAAVNDQGDISNLSSFKLIDDFSEVISEAGSIVQVRIHFAETTAHTREYALIVQGEDTQEESGAYLRMDRVEKGALTLWEPNADGIRAADDGGENVKLSLLGSTDKTKWEFEKIDLDLDGIHYFSVDPAELYQDDIDGWHYTTLRASWNVKFLKTGDDGEENMKAYVVTGVNDDGEMSLTELTGNIIPKGLPVLLACRTTSTENNRMIPTNAAATTADQALTTLLKNSVKYFPNQPVPEAAPSGQAYYALGKTSEGRVGFVTQVTNTTKGLNGNRGYYLGPVPVVLPLVYSPVTLSELVESGKQGGLYEVTDLTWVSEASDNDTEQLVFCKDDNKYANPDKNNLAEDTMTDFMAMSGIGGKPAASYDESNWIALRVPRKFELTVDMINAPLANVKGRYLNTVNPELLLTEQPTKRSESTKYEPNLYIPASFAGTQVSTVNENTYFFVTPKPMEVANVKWAIWDGDKFITPPTTGSSNQFNLSGGFGFNQTYLDYLDKSFEGLDKYVGYEMLAVVKLAQQQGGNSAPRRAEGSKNYVAWPLAIQRDQQIITAVTDVFGKREVVSTLYYNVAGMPSLRPYDGLNIVVTRYSDGSTKTAKIVY